MLTKLSQSFRKRRTSIRTMSRLTLTALGNDKVKSARKIAIMFQIKKKLTKQWQAALEQTIARLEKEIDHRKKHRLAKFTA